MSAPIRPTPPDTRTLPLHDAIARQARRLWESYGCPAGRDVAIWLEAERQVLGVDREVRREAGATAPAETIADTLYPPGAPTTDLGDTPAAMPPNGAVPDPGGAG